MRKHRRVRRCLIDCLETRRMLSTYTVNGAGGADYSDLQTALSDVPAGSTLLVYPGTYTAHPTDIDTNSVFWITKSMTLESVAGPSSTVLAVPAGTPQNLLVSASDVTVEGFSLEHGDFGADVQDVINAGTLTNETLKDLVISTDVNSNGGHGILYETVSDSIIDDCTIVLSYANGIMLDNNSENDIVENCTVNGTVTQGGIEVQNSDYNLITGNTETAAAFEGLLLVTSSNNRVVDNSLAGFGNDGLCLTSASDDNYVGLNTVASSGYADGHTTGAGIWLNDESDGNTVYGNNVSGNPECGIDVFVSSDNLIQGNDVWGNYEGGIFLFDAYDYPPSVGNVPSNTVIINNYIHDNKTNGGVTLAGAVNTEIADNYISGSYTGVAGSSEQSGLSSQRTTGTQFFDNTIVNVSYGVYVYATTTGLSVYRNRFINTGESFALTGAGVAFDDGATMGGNYWSNHPSTKPYTSFAIDAAGKRGAGYIDGHPFANQALNEPYSVNITAPIAGTEMAAFSKRVIQWSSTGSTLVDLYYTSPETGDVPIASNLADTGFYVWTVPDLAAYSDYQIKIVPKNSSGQVEGPAALSGDFSVSNDSGLTLLTPGDNQTAASGSQLTVAWANATASTPVDVQLQTDGGTWTTLASSVTGDETTVTLPNVTTDEAHIRILDESTGTGDEQDGYFRIADSAAVNPLSDQLVGGSQTISWLSPAGAVTAEVQFWNGTTWQSIATRTPDLGHFNWFVPQAPTTGASVMVQFYNGSGGEMTSATGNAFNIQYTLAAGAEATVYALSNPKTHAQFYTTQLSQYRSMARSGWTAAGASFVAANGPITLDGISDVPEYQLYNPTTKQCLLTTDSTEYDSVQSETGWQAEGVAFYVFSTPIPGSIPLYRSANGDPPTIEQFTTNVIAYDKLSPRKWTREGVVAYVIPLPRR